MPPKQKIKLFLGDCVERMREIEDNLVVVVSDPPYGISFMGREWDHLDWEKEEEAFSPEDLQLPNDEVIICGDCEGPVGLDGCDCGESPPSDQQPSPGAGGKQMQESHGMWLREAFRIIQPGGVIKAFSGSRTSHRLAAAMAQAGFVDLKIVPWVYGSGFPKSLNISKKIDRAVVANRTRFLLKALAKMGMELGSIKWVPDADPEKTTEVRVPIGRGKYLTFYRLEDNVFVQHPLFRSRDKKTLSAEDTSFRNWAASENADGQGGWSRPWIKEAREKGSYEVDGDTPVTHQGVEMNGWGTAFKPAYEPVVVGYKPVELSTEDKYAGIPPWELL